MIDDFTAPEPLAYFDGQRLTAADLAAAQDFHRELRWLHNRALHATGIVEGLPVEGARDDIVVRVGSGLALDGLGRELLLVEPLTVAVPPIAAGAPGQPAALVLTLRYDSDPVVAASQAGVCDTAGAVRLAERPLVRFRSLDEMDPAIDVVLAGVLIRDCRLAQAPTTAERRVVATTSPRVDAGRTPAGSTTWRNFSIGGAVAGVETTVDTSAAGFQRAPIYQARVGGLRGIQPFAQFADGPVVIADPTSTSFVLRMILAGPIGTAPGPIVNPIEVLSPDFLDQAREELEWHVVWMGVDEV